ncbi:MAG: 2-hydroxyacyl-CoA dehydratase family protein [Planctomycetota bacterium]
MRETRERVGITSSVPVEVLFAAGARPVDLNNAFITSGRAREIVEEAEAEGFPRNVCAWVKGIYEAARRDGGMKRIVAVTQGDCTNVRALIERWRAEGKRVIPFSYPYDRDREMLAAAIRKLRGEFGVSQGRAAAMKTRLDRIRRKLARVDRLAWRENKVTGTESHEWIIAGSDFRGDPDAFEKELDAFLAEAGARKPRGRELRLGLIGIPPIWSDFFGYVEERGARVVYNELARQFALLPARRGMLEQYLRYTYPYDSGGRVREIRRAVRERGLDGLIHNVQSFCFHQIEDVVLRARQGVPTVLVEGDKPGPLDARTRMRLDSFLGILRKVRRR